MSNYDKVLAEFHKLGYDENSYLQRNEIDRAMDAICSRNANFAEFDRSIGDEMWSHCQMAPNGSVRVRDYANAIVEADGILREQIGVTEGALRNESRPKERADLQ
jgi:hypothetical protein